MTRLLTSLYLMPSLAPVVKSIYTGFNYGAFWSDQANVKQMPDFRDGFNDAKNLSSQVTFDSARLYTCRTHNTMDEPTGAFEAAVQTQTNLLLGFWITPGKRGDPIDVIVKNEMSALEKGFQKHGQALSDLIIGLSVGSEDIYRWEQTEESGLSAQDVSLAIKKVKESIDGSSFAKYMKGKPIGHVDTAQWAVVDGADFYGITAYPYWTKEDISKANQSFHSSLEEVKQRAGNTPVWIAEMGWPFQGESKGAAVASAENQQIFWSEVGCSIVGTYNLFWFQLLRDSESNQPDWGILDAITHSPRIKDMSCGQDLKSNTSSKLPISVVSSEKPDITIPTNTPTSSLPVMTPSSVLETSAAMSDVTETSLSTTHVTITITTTIQPPTPSADPEYTTDDEPDYEDIETTITTTVTTTITSTIHLKPSSSIMRPKAPITVTWTSASLIAPVGIPWCVTVADINRNGQYVPVAGNTAGPDGKCTPPPTYTGLPYVLSTEIPVDSTRSSAAIPNIPSHVLLPSTSSLAVQPPRAPKHSYCIRKSRSLATPSQPIESSLTSSVSTATRYPD